MIKMLKLKKYQAHDDTTLMFKPGVNAIIGSSDKGKSSILRGLRWLVFNRPSGFSFRSHWASGKDVTEVELLTSEGVTITRVRDEYQNAYTASNIDGKLEAVRTGVPEEITKILGLDELNLQRQGDKPFLLDETPGEVARILNSVAGLEGIDEAHTKMASKTRENQEAIRQANAMVTDYAAKLKKFSGLEELRGCASVLITKEAMVASRKESLAKFDRLIIDITYLESSIARRFKTLDDVAKAITGCEQGVKKSVQLAAQFANIDGLIGSIDLHTSTEAITKDWLKDVGSTIDDIEVLTRSTVGADVSSIGELISLIDSHTSTNVITKDWVKTIEIIVQDITALIRSTVNADVLKLASIGNSIKLLNVKSIDGDITKLEQELGEFKACPECGALREHWGIS